MVDSLLARAKLITGCTDAELAEVVGLSGPTTTSYANGNRREYLNAAQIDALTAWLEEYATGVRRAVDEFVLFA
jgi:hypothetical protein